MYETRKRSHALLDRWSVAADQARVEASRYGGIDIFNYVVSNVQHGVRAQLKPLAGKLVDSWIGLENAHILADNNDIEIV